MLNNLRTKFLLRKAFSILKTPLKNYMPSSYIKPNTLRKSIAMNSVTQTGIPLHEVLEKLNDFADLSLAASWDNVGLLIEPFTLKPVGNILLTIDLTETVMEEAIKKNIDLIISYHPPIFGKLSRITRDTWKQRLVGACLESRIAVYSPHTAWDAVHGGVTDWLAGAFEKFILPNGKRAITPSAPKLEMYQVTLIGSTDILNSICKDSDFIHVARYELDGKNVCTIYCSYETLQKLKGIDDITMGVVQCYKDEKIAGFGRVLQVSVLTINDCVKLVKERTGLPHVRLSLGKDKTNESPVTTIALVPGAGGEISKLVRADLFVTGEMRHHDIIDINHNGTSVILTNHSDSERGFLSEFKVWLDKAFENTVQIIISTTDSDPLKTI